MSLKTTRTVAALILEDDDYVRCGRDTRTKRQLIEDRKGLCDICGKSSTNGRSLSSDHNHKTGKCRGFLCTRCNMALGYFQDDIARIRKAADYLEKYAT